MRSSKGKDAVVPSHNVRDVDAVVPRKGCGRPKSQRLKDDDDDADAKERMRTVKDDDELMMPRKGCAPSQG